MPKLVLDAANDLADAPVADRHLVIVLGTTLPDGPVLDRLREVALAAGIRVHVVASIGLEAGTIEALSDETGGSSPVAPATVGEMDEVTRVIADRYRVAATVDTPGAARGHARRRGPPVRNHAGGARTRPGGPTGRAADDRGATAGDASAGIGAGR